MDVFLSILISRYFGLLAVVYVFFLLFISCTLQNKLISYRYKSKSLPQAESPHSPSLLPFFLVVYYFFLFCICFIPFCLASSFINLSLPLREREFSSSSFLFNRVCHTSFAIFMLFRLWAHLFFSRMCKPFLFDRMCPWFFVSRKKCTIKTINHETNLSHLKAIKMSWAYGLEEKN